MTTTATYNCEVQPPTPIMCNGTFSEFANNSQNGDLSSAHNQNQQQQHLSVKQQEFLRRSGSSNGSSFDMTQEDSASTSNDSMSQHSMTHDPYRMNVSNNSSIVATHSHHRQPQYNEPEYPQYCNDNTMQAHQQSNNGGEYTQYQQEFVPPSLQLASQSRRRQQDEDLFPESTLNNYNQQQQQEYPYPQQQQNAFQVHTSERSAMSSQEQQQQNNNSSAQASKPFPECCYHKALVNRMEFIQPPAVTSAGNFGANTRSTNYLRVFVGQCRFEATPAEIRWLIHYLTGVQPVKVELRGTGCFMTYVTSYDEVHALLQLKEKLLFDHTGVWYARDEEQASFLRRYVQSYVAGIGKGFRLPKDMVVLHDQQQVQQQRHQSGSIGGHKQQNQFTGRGNNHSNVGHHHQQQHQQRSQTNNFYQNHGAQQVQQQYASEEYYYQ